jgi:hypothetical protein
MKKLYVLTATAGILLALAGPSLAAQRAPRGVDAYASADRSGAYNYGPQGGQGARAQVQTPAQHQYNRAPNYGQNLPYPDRPYGDPDRW